MAEFPENVRVIVPVHNTRQQILHLLDHLRSLHHKLPNSVFVVDDGSSDGTHEALRVAFPGSRVLRGNGSLFWTGAIRKGMEQALAEAVPYLFWLNHDCQPEPGSFEKLLRVLQDPEVGCVSALCYIAGHPGYPVNPGFRHFRPVLDQVGAGLLTVDGLNGNFVGFRADAVSRVGLPDEVHYPHYGDGPYTVRFSRAGYLVRVEPQARAALNYECERRLAPFWRVTLSSKSGFFWLRYFFTSFKSPHHWKNRWHESLAFRGPVGILSYLKTQLSVLLQIFAGLLWQQVTPRAQRVRQAIAAHQKRFPAEKLRAELDSGVVNQPAMRD
ncbi:MAG: glycosyltransferase family 2 protein [Verrucomicrobiia bacterium]